MAIVKTEHLISRRALERQVGATGAGTAKSLAATKLVSDRLQGVDGEVRRGETRLARSTGNFFYQQREHTAP